MNRGKEALMHKETPSSKKVKYETSIYLGACQRVQENAL